MILMATEMMMKIDGDDGEHEHQSIKWPVFVNMVCRSWAGLIQNPGFDGSPDELLLQITMGTCPRDTGITGGHDTRHLTRAPFLSLTMRSPQEATNFENEEIRKTVQPN